MKSLTMLLASGIQTNIDEIVPMIIDTDQNNGDLEQFRKIIDDYIKINEKLYSNVSPKEYQGYFFRTKIQRPKEMNVGGLDFGTLNEMLNYSGLNASGHSETKFLLDLLFSEENLNMNLENGFLGNPNVGVIVLKHVMETREFKDFTLDFQEGDRIFIINSIFGGTGAAGFPLLLKVFRDSESGINNIGLINAAIIGSVTVLPYFEVDVEKFQEGESAINSDTFISKTKAALSYYDRHVGNLINALYYIGDNKKSSYENVEGGTEQKNPANFIEFAAAHAIIDFIQYEPEASTIMDLSKPNRYFEFGIDKDESPINFTYIKETNGKNKIKPLILLKYFSVYITNYLSKALNNKSLAWKNDLGITSSFYNNDFTVAVVSFFENHFYRWLAEMSFSNHGRRFVPFNLYIQNGEPDNKKIDGPVKLQLDKDRLFTLVNDLPAKRNDKVFSKDEIKFDRVFNEAAQETLKKNLPSTEISMIDIFQNGLERIYNERFKY
jgi:hypothetical protein